MELKILIEYSAPSLPILPLEMYEEIKKHLPPPRPKKCIYINRNRKLLYTKRKKAHRIWYFMCCVCGYKTIIFKEMSDCRDCADGLEYKHNARKDIVNHLYKHHLNECYKCKECDSYFTKKKKLAYHMRLHHFNII